MKLFMSTDLQALILLLLENIFESAVENIWAQYTTNTTLKPWCSQMNVKN